MMYATKNLPPETLASLVDASAAINAAQGLDETLGAIARAAAAVMRAEAASVIMLDPARNKQVFRAAIGDRAETLLGIEYEQGLGISGMVFRSGRAMIINDVTREHAHYKDIDALVGFHTRSIIAAPLINKDQTLGVVEVLNPVQGGRFSDKDAQLAQFFGNLAAIAIANSQLYDRLRRDNRGLKHAVRSPQEMIGLSQAIEAVKQLIGRVARSTTTVLLLGETGTGKELAARMVHINSDRGERPFIPVNCAALPKTLLESELFGHEAGAFTGAIGKKLGRFELADGGTIFLDEIAEMDQDVQVKLLRVLQEKEIVPVGGVAARSCDARVIAATNRDLRKETGSGWFREDLYYRLSVFPIEIPPLRDRKEDIPLLVEHSLKRLAAEMKMAVPTISGEALACISAHDFPGNIRELQNILERASLLCCGPEDVAGETPCIRQEHLPREIVGGDVEAVGGSALQANEKAIIINALRKCNWNQSQAARMLGINRDSIRYRMRKYEIERPA